jgi:hypothetical protein
MPQTGTTVMTDEVYEITASENSPTTTLWFITYITTAPIAQQQVFATLTKSSPAKSSLIGLNDTLQWQTLSLTRFVLLHALWQSYRDRYFMQNKRIFLHMQRLRDPDWIRLVSQQATVTGMQENEWKNKEVREQYTYLTTVSSDITCVS